MNAERTKEVAVKFEKISVKNSVLWEEIKIIDDLKGGVGIPEVLWYGKHDDYKVMIMNLLGPSLDKFYKVSHKQFNLDTTIYLGSEMIKRIEFVHSKNYLHRDIKPNNFLLGKFSRDMRVDNTVYIIDFGLSKTFLDPDTGRHYSFKDDRRFVGTPRYASLNTHLGVRQSRRDDLESILFILVYFLKGDLPWQGVKAKTKSEKKRKIMKKKSAVSPSELCSEIPKEFCYILDYIRSLKFEEKPNYEFLLNLLQKIKMSYIETPSLEWDWNIMFLASKKLLNESSSNYLDQETTSSESENAIVKYNKYKRYYEKLYDGYPVPTYDEYLKILEKRNMIANEEPIVYVEDSNDLNLQESEFNLNRVEVEGNSNKYKFTSTKKI
jgi:serine/threonine protein kinase